VHLILASNEPGRAYSALVLALGAVTMGVKCKIYCTMNALEIVKKGGAAKINMLGAPPWINIFMMQLMLAFKLLCVDRQRKC